MGLSFKLSDTFYSAFTKSQPAWGPLGYITYKRTYSRDLTTLYPRHEQIGRQHGLVSEEYWLTILRVVEGTFSILKDHCTKLRLPWNEESAQLMAEIMYEQLWEFRWLPPGRGLWTMGTPIVEAIGGAALNNCAFVSTKDLESDPTGPFCFLMDMTMLGVGVGADCLGADTVRIHNPKLGDIHFIEDTREGWVEALRLFLEAYLLPDRKEPLFNYSQIRPRGTKLKTFGGEAAGPDVCHEMFVNLSDLLNRHQGKLLSAANIVDIFNIIGKYVAAGGARRSAEIMFGEATDEIFMDLKNPEVNSADLRSHRWASNNSVFAKVGQSYASIAKRIKKNGEPGLIWLDNARRFSRMGEEDNKDAKIGGANPCLEQSLESYELCCLAETFPANHSSAYEFKQTTKYAYLYAKAVTLVPTHNPRTNAVLLRNRRIGCSMSGIVQAINRHGFRSFINLAEKAYDYLGEIDAKYSDWLCVPKSIKRTSVKPSGTVSLLCGATPGIHYPIAEYYFRVIRFDSKSALLTDLREAGYRCEEIKNEPHTTAVYFPVKETNFVKGESQVTMWEQLELAAALQKHWADNQVSVTIKFQPHEANDIERALEMYETRLKGVSFLPASTHDYKHAPYQPITEEEYNRANYVIVALDELNSAAEVQDNYCDGDKCYVAPRPA